MYTIKNNKLQATFITKGAQLSSLVALDNNIDYIWNGDAKYWSYQTPPLFPIVGKVVNDTYQVEDKKYHLKQHGIARLYDHQLFSQSDNQITFLFESNEATRLVYPYDFKFYTIYTLEDDTLEVKYQVENTDAKTINFQLGAHPAFNIPFTNNSNYDDYQFRFETKEMQAIKLLNEQGNITKEKQAFLNNEKIIKINKQLFSKDALIMENLNSSYIILESSKEASFLKFSFKDFPLLALWARSDDAPFLCIEPWFGHADYDGFTGQLKDKEGVITLESTKSFSCAYQLSIGLK